jgi:hypothetical protein
MSRWRPLFAPAVVSIALAVAAHGFAAEAGEAAFEKLKSLAGDWETKTAKGSTLRVSYRLASRESVLVETWAPGTKAETLTVFHLDGPDLLATHYCAQGNQPRLKLKSAAGNAYELELKDATNLARPGASHMRKLRLELVDADHFTKEETYVEEGKDDVSTLRFTRTKSR